MAENNPLLNDRNVEFLLYEVFEAESLCRLPYFADHSRETFDLYLQMCRKFAREVLFPAYKPMDAQAAELVGERIVAHPRMREIYPQLVELGVINATRPYDVEGQQLPMLVFAQASAYLAAANLSAVGYTGLTSGAAHLIEVFGTEQLKRDYMQRMYAGEWTGTMALTEPHAGSSLADIRTRARPTDEGHYLIDGNKIYISGGDQDFTDNIVHLTLARIEGAPAGTKGISLFAVPKKRVESGALVDNDVHTAGTFHKLGYRGIASIALSFGENERCHGYLVGEPHKGLKYMFQMMNEARIGVGGSAMATATVAFQESLLYAMDRPQGRRFGQKPQDPPVSIIEHADVRRMLLRQKAICEGAQALIAATSRYADLAHHADSEAARRHAQTLLDLLTPMAKSFPSEKGFESNALAVQVLGGAGYTDEYLPEAWLRDQKLNSIHEGTTGIQSMDLLGRKVLGTQGASLAVLAEEVKVTLTRAEKAGVDKAWIEAMQASVDSVSDVTMKLGEVAMKDVEAAMRHSVDYLDLMSTLCVAWQWLFQATVVKERYDARPDSRAFYEGKLRAAQYWFNTEVPRIPHLAALIQSGEDSFAAMTPELF